jgi:hypothetical protein
MSEKQKGKGNMTLVNFEDKQAQKFDVTSAPQLDGKPSLAKKLATIIGASGWIPKNGFNAHFKYNFATDADILDALRQLFAKYNVAHLMSVIDVTREQIAEGDGKRRATFLTHVRTRHTFLCGDTGEAVSVDGFGTGEDSGDKGVYKAQTGALKYALLKTFLIPTGDDPEYDNESERTQSSGGSSMKSGSSTGNSNAPGTRADIGAAFKAKFGSDIDAMKAKLKEVTGYDSLAAIPDAEVPVIAKKLKSGELSL